MQLFSLLLFVFSLALTQAFKVGEDAGGATVYADNAQNRLNPYYFGSFPFTRAFTTRPKFAPTYVETFAPTSTNILVTDPGHQPHSIPQQWQLGISSVVAVGPGVAAAFGATINEGDLVYSAQDCPMSQRVWLNKPTGESARLCKSIVATLPDYWCQARGCSPLFADKCAWQTPPTYTNDRASAYDPRFTQPTYCILNAMTDIKGVVQVASYGIDRDLPNVSRLEKPRDRWTSWRREDASKDVTTGI